MVRVGIVTAVDNEKRLARAVFPDTGIPSDWLAVLVGRDFIPSYDGAQRTESSGGGSGMAAFESHTHALNIRPWMPKVGEQVLALYEDVPNGRGFVLGGIQAWR